MNYSYTFTKARSHVTLNLQCYACLNIDQQLSLNSRIRVFLGKSSTVSSNLWKFYQFHVFHKKAFIGSIYLCVCKVGKASTFLSQDFNKDFLKIIFETYHICQITLINTLQEFIIYSFILFLNKSLILCSFSPTVVGAIGIFYLCS